MRVCRELNLVMIVVCIKWIMCGNLFYDNNMGNANIVHGRMFTNNVSHANVSL